MRMNHVSILSNSEKLLSLDYNYLKWKEFWLLYLSEQGDKALKGAQEILLKIQKLKQTLEDHNLWEHVSTSYTNRITAIECFFGIFSSLWASRIWGNTGTNDPVWNIMMQDVETLMSKIQNFIMQDHVLHVKLCQLYVKIKFLNTDINPENLARIDDFYKEATRWRVNCGNSFNCVYSGCLIDNICMEVAWRANNWRKSAMLGLKVRENLTENPQIRNDKASKIVLGFLNCHYMEKSRLLHNEVDELNYMTEGLHLLKSSFKKTPTSHICRLYRNLAAKSLVDKSMNADDGVKRARRYLDRANSVWKRLINLSKNNVNHPRYLIQLMFQNYFMYQTTKNELFARNLQQIFPKLLPRLIASPEIDNLDTLEMALRIKCEVSNFQEAFEVCKTAKETRKHEELNYPFGIILSLVEEISTAKTFPPQTVLTRLVDQPGNSFEKALLGVRRSEHTKCPFWYNFGSKIYIGILQKAGKNDQIEQFCALAGKFPSDVLATWHSRKNSTASSLASISEIIEVLSSSIGFDVIICGNIRGQPVSFLSKVLNLQNTISTTLGVCRSNICQFVTEESFFEFMRQHYVTKRVGGQIVFVMQISDQLNEIASAEVVKNWVQKNVREETKFTWLLMESVHLIGDVTDENSNEGVIIPTPLVSKNNYELLVTASETKIHPEIGNLQDDQCKMLTECLATVLQESVERYSAEQSQELDSLSTCGDLGLSIQSICSKMQQEFDLNSRSYICSQPLTEMLPTKEFYITFQSDMERTRSQ